MKINTYNLNLNDLRIGRKSFTASQQDKSATEPSFADPSKPLDPLKMAIRKVLDATQASTRRAEQSPYLQPAAKAETQEEKNDRISMLNEILFSLKTRQEDLVSARATWESYTPISIADALPDFHEIEGKLITYLARVDGALKAADKK